MKPFFFAIILLAFLAPHVRGAVVSGAFPPLSEELYLNMAPHQAAIPPLGAGRIRIKAPLTSLFAKIGMYYYGGSSNADAAYCDWTSSKFGIVGWNGPGTGSLWFFADLDAGTGAIEKVHVYGVGICGSPPCEAAFLLNQKAGGSYGEADARGFSIRASGIGIGSYDGKPVDNLCRDDAGIIINGAGDILKAAKGAKIPVRFYLGFWGRGLKAGRLVRNTDQGFGMAIIERK